MRPPGLRLKFSVDLELEDIMNIKKNILLCLLLSISLFAFSGDSGKGPSISIERISDRAIVLSVDGISKNNVIALKSQKGLIIVDTDISPVFARHIRKKIQEEFHIDDFAYVINTHGHGDHTWGNQVFSDAVIIGQEDILQEADWSEEEARKLSEMTGHYLERLKKRQEGVKEDPEQAEMLTGTISYYSAVLDGLGQDFTPTPPSVTFKDRLNLDLGDIHLYLYSFGRAHSLSDMIIHYPEGRLLMTGDLFIARMNPPYMKTENVNQFSKWCKLLDEILSRDQDIVYVIPGHDDFLSLQDLKEIHKFIEDQTERVRNKKSAFSVFEKTLEESGIDEALSELRGLKGRPGEYYILEADFIGQGYLFLRQKKNQAAVEIFKTVVDVFPDSWNAFDCLGEACAESGDKESALINYRKSLELNPENSNAARQIETLLKGKK